MNVTGRHLRALRLVRAATNGPAWTGAVADRPGGRDRRDRGGAPRHIIDRRPECPDCSDGEVDRCAYLGPDTDD